MKQKITWILIFSLLAALFLTAFAGASEDTPQLTDQPLRAVVLYDEHTDSAQLTAVLAETEGVTLLCEYDTLLTGAAVEADARTLAKLRSIEGVTGVGAATAYDCTATPPGSNTTLATVSAEAGLALMEAAGLVEEGHTGDGTVIAVLDSGCNVDHEVFADASLVKSPALTQADVDAYAAKGGTKGRYVSARIPFAYDYYSRDDDVSTTNHHGTHVTALAAGYAKDTAGQVTFQGAAPGAQILSMKIFPDGSGSGTDETIILRALEDAYNLGADAVNISVGIGAGFSGSDTMNGAFCSALARMEASGMVLFCAAGNSGSYALKKDWGQSLPTSDYTDYSALCSPGSYYGSLAVAAASENGHGGVTIAKYSSWGPAASLHLAPALTAFGGPVASASASGSDGYRRDEGTSMASPYTAGIYAVLLQSVRERGVTGKVQAAVTAKGLLESRSKLLTDSSGKLPLSPRRQGAGYIDLSASLAGNLLVANPLIELGDNANGSFTMPITLQNLSNQAMTVSLDVIAFTDDYKQDGGTTYSSMSPRDITSGVTVSGDRSVSVPANGTATATLTLSVTDWCKAELEKIFPNGFYVEGYIAASGSGETAHAAYLGYCGDWSAGPVLEPVDFRDIQNTAARLLESGAVTSERAALPENLNDCLAALGANAGANLAFVASASDVVVESGALLGYNGHANLPHDDARNSLPAASAKSQFTGGHVLCLDVYTLRDAVNAVFVVSDVKTGAVYCTREEPLLEKSTDNSYGLGLDPAARFSWDGTDAKNTPLSAGTQVRVDVYVWLENDKDIQSARAANSNDKTAAWLLAKEYASYRVLSFPVTLDGAAPTADAALSGNTLTLTVHDDQYTAYAAVMDTNGKVLSDEAYAPAKTGEDCMLTVDFANVPDKVYVRLEDYAANTGVYELDLKALSGGEDAIVPCASILIQDVKAGDWYHEAVDYVVENGIMLPDEDMKFGPNGAASRWNIVDALYRANGSPKSSLTLSDLPFHDVSSRTRYADALCWAYENGIVAGKSDGGFYGVANVTRQEFVAMFYRCAKLAGKDGISGSLSGYPDAGSVSSWAADSMCWAVGAGLIKGNSGGNLAPTSNVTRGETAQILMRFLEMQ